MQQRRDVDVGEVELLTGQLIAIKNPNLCTVLCLERFNRERSSGELPRRWTVKVERTFGVDLIVNISRQG